jgi:ABC-type branched-subunit amino acid transport system substrate-binding protein
MDRRTFVRATGAGVALGCASLARAAFEPVAAGDVIAIGQSAVLSGLLGQTALVMQAGARLAFDEVNAQGGIGDRKLKLIALDDAFDPAKAQANYQTLIQKHNVLACFGGVGAATTLAALPQLRSGGTPLVGATAVVDSVRDKAEGIGYFTRASQQREATALVQHLHTLGIRRLAVGYFNSKGGEEVLAQIRQAAEKSDMSVLGAAAVDGDGGNAAAAGKALSQMRAQAVILYLTAAPAAGLVQAVWADGGAPSFYGMSILAGDVAAKLLGPQSHGIAISQVTPFPWDAADADATRYRQAAQAAKVPLGYHSYEGYISARVLVQAIRLAGRDLSRASLHASLRKLKTRVATLDVDFSAGQSTGSEFVELVQVRSDGRYVR